MEQRGRLKDMRASTNSIEAEESGEGSPSHGGSSQGLVGRGGK